VCHFRALLCSVRDVWVDLGNWEPTIGQSVYPPIRILPTAPIYSDPRYASLIQAWIKPKVTLSVTQTMDGIGTIDVPSYGSIIQVVRGLPGQTLPPLLAPLPFVAHVWDVETTPLTVREIPLEAFSGKCPLVLMGSVAGVQYAAEQVMRVAPGCFEVRSVAIYAPSEFKEYRMGEGRLCLLLPSDRIDLKTKRVCHSHLFFAS
jgi:hypothetical protein